jgi:membrane-associated phospholipid phosphatase
MKKTIAFARMYGPVILSLALPIFASAQIPPAQPPQPSNVPQSNITSLQSVLNTLCVVFGWAFWFLVVLAVIFVIVAAFRYLTAGGNPENVGKAGSTLL